MRDGRREVGDERREVKDEKREVGGRRCGKGKG